MLLFGCCLTANGRTSPAKLSAESAGLKHGWSANITSLTDLTCASGRRDRGSNMSGQRELRGGYLQILLLASLCLLHHLLQQLYLAFHVVGMATSSRGLATH